MSDYQQVRARMNEEWAVPPHILLAVALTRLPDETLRVTQGDLDAIAHKFVVLGWAEDGALGVALGLDRLPS